LWNALRNCRLFAGIAVISNRGPFEDVPQSPQVDWFREKHVEPGLAAPILIGGGEIRANRNRGQTGSTLPGLGHEIITVTIGQPDIADDDVDGALVQNLESARGAIARRDLVAPAAENSREGLLGVIVVLNKEDGAEGIEASRHISYSSHDPSMVGFYPTLV
jgi:hypothetical protein